MTNQFLLYIIDLLKICVPALIVLWLANRMLSRYFENEEARRRSEVSKQISSKTLPIRLQAYERLTLFLERNSLESLLRKNAGKNQSVEAYARSLADTVSTEFEHNLAQQLYVSRDAWNMVCKAKDDFIQAISTSLERLGEDRSPSTLNDQLVQIAVEGKLKSNEAARLMLHKELKETLNA